ncbi:MAG: metalloregulator ArsR/SmtB family transcription factor [Patescibacteria group bacterium]
MKDLEKVLKALANRRRLAMLKYLKNNKQGTVGEIAGEINLSFKATSKHLTILAACDLVEREQKSLQVFYQLSGSAHPVGKQIISIL